MQIELWILLRLCVAGILSGFIGFEREQTGKRAGLRTHMLVAIGATLYVSVSDIALSEAKRLADDPLPSYVRYQISPLDAVQAVAAGIGFLGAGTIFVSSRHTRVYGLTTAASIWTTASLGVIIAFDRYLLAAGATAMILFILHVLMRFEPHDPPPEKEPTTDPAAPPPANAPSP